MDAGARVPKGAGRTQRWRAAAYELLWGRQRRGIPAEAARVLAVALWKFRQDRGFLRASALTYTSLLSVVPLLALMFSVLKGLGVQRRLEPLLLEHIAVGNEEIVARILEYVDRTQVGTLGAVGLVMLLLTVVSVLGNIELTFNDIWQVRRGRSALRKVADYIALLVVGPILLLASISVTTTLQTPGVREKLSLVGQVLPVVLKSLPFLSIWLAFTAMYVIMPNRRVPLRSALLGGVVAGSFWHLAQWSYIRFQFGMARYNAIYGAMAQLPILLVWLYVSWCIVILGAELAFVHHLPGRGRFLKARGHLWVPRLDAALAVLLTVARRFESAAPPPSEAELIEELDLDPPEARRIIGRLTEVGLLAATQDDPPGLLPARSPDRTSVPELLEAVARFSELRGVEPTCFGERLLGAVGREFEGATWAELAVAAAPSPPEERG
ncbi:MAG: YihY/virulence factor BrkB family protein [Deferrisomatales bacterium]